jgi:acetone carboxylase gamma subunit
MGKATLILTLVSSLLLASSVLGVSLRSRNPLAGQYQEDTIGIWEKVLDGAYYGERTKYNDIFRPPTVSSDGSPAPTVVDLSLNSFRVKRYNETEGTLAFDVNVVIEYEDSRLLYDPPRDNQRYFQFLRAPRDYTSIWEPKIVAVNAEEFSVDYLHDYDQETILSPSGHVYRQNPKNVELKALDGVNDDGASGKKFELTLIDPKDSIEDVQYKWREQEPFRFGDYGKTFKTEDGLKYNVKPKLESCKRVKNYGSVIGQQEVTCIKLGITMFPA